LLVEEHALQIPDLEIAPMGVAEQLGVSETGEFIEKLRITHDLSFPAPLKRINELIIVRMAGPEVFPCRMP